MEALGEALRRPSRRSDMSTVEKPILSEPYVLSRHAGVYDVWFPSTPQARARYRAKVAGEQTQGRLSQIHLVEPRGAAPPVHLHHDADETLYVIEGDVSVFLGDDRIEAGPGAFIFVPRGAVHTWLVRSEQAELFLTLVPAGLEGFFAEVGSAAITGEPMPREMDVDTDELNRRAEAYGVEFRGPPPTLAD
jgi:quercetin dioxygenase-like cupin family protein